MRVLVVGAGGREHALVWALAASPLLTKLWCAPGNPGTGRLAENVPIGVLDIAALVAFARANRVDLVVPGPEAPLVAGIADAMAAAGIACCGPTAAAARLEGSKAFTKEVCDAAGIPTARWEAFEDAEAARSFVRRRGAPIVVKADGLAAGKGVVVAQTVAEAEAAITDFLEARRLGEAGARLVIEEALEGEEVSLFALCDGAHAIGFGAAADHKRLGEGDTGPNTGGMGAISPPPGFGAAEQAAALAGLVRPALAELARRGTPFRGFLFAGLMLTADGPKLLEFNVRLGDPEAQCLLPRLQSDLLAALLATCDGELGAFDLRWRDVATLAVVMAAKGYPAAPVLHAPLGSLAAAEAVPDALVFHAGTAARDGRLVSAGGRVLTVCGSGPDFAAAHAAAYRAVAAIDWPEGYFRRDIGWRALAAEGARARR
ncbi:MAG: phosphoribosylamine--glycine ligase [Alphaproteobacteria bacterium]|nr:phosphoribosylamine--glycine ligase [Alphaproteobacteria bacterium]